VLRSSLGGLSGRLVYGGGWLRALLIALCLSWGAMNLIALVIERRTLLLHPDREYTAFYYGDSLCLPAITLMIWYLGRHTLKSPNLSQKRWWHWACFVLGVAGGITIHVNDSFSRFYTRSQMYSPTKLYHDFVVVPCYTYILFSAGIPVIFQSKGGIRWRLAIVVIGLVFYGLNFYDMYHRKHDMHINFDWRRFSPG